MRGRYVSPDDAAIEREWHIGRRNSNPFTRRFNVGPSATALLKQHAVGDFVHHAVSTRVNSRRNDDEMLSERPNISTGS